MDLGWESLNLDLCDGIWVGKGQIWVFAMGFGSEKFEFGFLWWDLGEEGSNLGLCNEIWVRKVQIWGFCDGI